MAYGEDKTRAVQTPRCDPKMKAIFDAKALSHQERAEMRALFDGWIKPAERGLLRVKIPQDMRTGQNLPGMHYHYRPELFFQLSGRTDFRFPREQMEVHPVCPE